MKDPYFDIDAISNSALKHFKKSPAHYKAWLSAEQVETPEMKFGSAFHCYCLEPDVFKNRYMVLDENKRPFPGATFRKKENAEWKAQQIKQCEESGGQLLSTDDLELIKILFDSLMRNEFAAELMDFQRNEFEKVVTWQRDGVACKAKIDIANEVFLADLKTTGDASPDGFNKTVARYEYYRQAAMYLDGFLPFGKGTFYFIAVEKTPPYPVAVYELSPEYIQAGRQEYLSLVQQFGLCKKMNYWPAYERFSSEYITLEPPVWLMKNVTI